MKEAQVMHIFIVNKEAYQKLRHEVKGSLISLMPNSPTV
jgi:hypothetical protein